MPETCNTHSLLAVVSRSEGKNPTTSVVGVRQELTCGYFLGRVRKEIDYPVNVRCVYYMPTKRRVDLTNLMESTHDILVKYNVLRDDNSKIIVSVDGSRVLYDKDNPRTEIEITPV